MTRLIVNNTDTAPGIFFPFQSITERDGEKCKPVATVNDFMIVIIQSLHEPIINSILFICLVYRSFVHLVFFMFTAILFHTFHVQWASILL